MKTKEILNELTLEEKAGLCSGNDFWTTKAIPEKGVESMFLSDGPSGLRKQEGETDHLGLNASIKTVCYPSSCLTACSFDVEGMRELGELLGDECVAEDVDVLLGPGVNIKRSPLCGRNFEYFSEDPYLSGELAASYIKGVQSKGVGTSVKHFAVNSQEQNRTTSSSNLSERALHEIYLPAFEASVKQAKPWSVMAAYNKVNGCYASENEKLLTDILRGEWGFEGFVVSDWSAVVHKVKGIEAGLDLEMPGINGRTDAKTVEAVKNGTLDEAFLDQAAGRMIEAAGKAKQRRTAGKNPVDLDAHHQKAAELAARSMVLLKNDGILPLNKDSKLAFIGAFAENPHFQGGGSAKVNPWKVDSVLDCVKDLNVVYAPGFSAETDERDDSLFAEAVEMAKQADAAVLFLGLPDTWESEGFDRETLDFPAVQNDLVKAVCEVQGNIVVVLQNGAPVLMPWLNKVNAVLESYLAGEGVGCAQKQILFGEVNPSGKLAETFPLSLGYTPAFGNFANGDKEVNYAEDIFVGYRWYDTRELPVLFPFGHGLSYTTFTYSNLTLSADEIKDTDTVQVTVDVTNNGTIAGDEIVQFYVSDQTKAVVRPEQELKAFARVSLAPCETKSVTVSLGKRAFAWYNTLLREWYCESGVYEIRVGKSSRQIELTAKLTLNSTVEKPIIINEDTILGDILPNPEANVHVHKWMAPFFKEFGEEQGKMGEAIVSGLPLRGMQNYAGLSDEQLEEAIQILKKIFYQSVDETDH